jgi:hypothetical protein
MVLAAGLLQGPWTDARLYRPYGTMLGICGVGLFTSGGVRPSPAVFVEDPAASGPLGTAAPGEFPKVGDALAVVFPEDRPYLEKNLTIVRVAPTALQASPAEPIEVGGERGHLGAPVHWGPVRGFLTAGHVGKKQGNAVVDASGAPIGSVAYANDPKLSQDASADVDIALVECGAGVSALNPLGIRSVATARANELVSVHTQRGALNATVVAYCSWFSAGPQGTFADVYLASVAVTAPGDSGAPVTLATSHQGVIGHVVAGGANTSCFQDIKPQLAHLRSVAPFAALAI